MERGRSRGSWAFAAVAVSQPTVSAEGGPSIIDVPSAGCWSFQLITKPDNRVVSTINLEALPTGSLPATGG